MTTLSQQCRFFAGKHVDVHDGRCFLPGSLPQCAKFIYERTLLKKTRTPWKSDDSVRLVISKVGGSNLAQEISLLANM